MLSMIFFGKKCLFAFMFVRFYGFGVYIFFFIKSVLILAKFYYFHLFSHFVGEGSFALFFDYKYHLLKTFFFLIIFLSFSLSFLFLCLFIDCLPAKLLSIFDRRDSFYHLRFAKVSFLFFFSKTFSFFLSFCLSPFRTPFFETLDMTFLPQFG